MPEALWSALNNGFKPVERPEFAFSGPRQPMIAAKKRPEVSQYFPDVVAAATEDLLRCIVKYARVEDLTL